MSRGGTRADFMFDVHIAKRLTGHGFTSYDSGLRTSQCGLGGLRGYKYHFPIDESTGRIAYQIDKPKARFINVCLPHELDTDSNEEGELASELSTKLLVSGNSLEEQVPVVNMDEVAQEKSTIERGGNETYEEKTIVLAISDCVNGRIFDVQST
jgi:hypothetical protein